MEHTTSGMSQIKRRELPCGIYMLLVYWCLWRSFASRSKAKYQCWATRHPVVCDVTRIFFFCFTNTYFFNPLIKNFSFFIEMYHIPCVLIQFFPILLGLFKPIQVLMKHLLWAWPFWHRATSCSLVPFKLVGCLRKERRLVSESLFKWPVWTYGSHGIKVICDLKRYIWPPTPTNCSYRSYTWSW